MDMQWATAHPVPDTVKGPALTYVRNEFGVSKPNYRQSELRHFSVYDEVYLGMGKFRKMMSWAGLFPVIETSKETNSNSMVEGLTYSFCSLQALYSIIPGFANFLVFYFGLWHYAFQLSDATEIIVFACFLVFFCVTAWINWFSCIIVAPHWQVLFRRFQVIDSLLDIEWDIELRSYGKFLTKMFATLGFVLGIGLAMLMIKQLLLQSDNIAHFTAIICFFTFAISCHFFPEALFVYLCKAVTIRMTRSANLLSRHFEENEADITAGIENVRIAHQLILDTVQHMNHLMGPILVAFCIFNTYTLCLCCYFFLLQSISILGMTPWKQMLLIIGSIRIVPLCLLANKVQEKTISTALCQIESSRYSKKCNDAVLFLLTNAEASFPSFTAWEFWDVDQGFLTTVTGILLTYAITALQFAKINKAADLQMPLDLNYNNSDSMLHNYTLFLNDTLFLNNSVNYT